MITIIGPTASGKTRLAANIAYIINSEIISADSRQVYIGMDIGTGKDLKDYNIKNKKVKYHLIDILPAGEKYNIHSFQKDFYRVYSEIINRGIAHPILCGGSGLYVESILRGYNLPDVPSNKLLRQNLSSLSIEQLKSILEGYGPLHNTTDLDSRQRAIRAIEIADYMKNTYIDISKTNYLPISSLVICLSLDREERRMRISERLKNRVLEGMIEEIQSLLNNKGLTAESLIYYGLEYKFVTLYVLGKLSKDDMLQKLEIAIHQYAKRQMTWFRGMQRRGIKVNYIDANTSLENQIECVLSLIDSYNKNNLI